MRSWKVLESHCHLDVRKDGIDNFFFMTMARLLWNLFPPSTVFLRIFGLHNFSFCELCFLIFTIYFTISTILKLQICNLFHSLQFAPRVQSCQHLDSEIDEMIAEEEAQKLPEEHKEPCNCCESR